MGAPLVDKRISRKNEGFNGFRSVYFVLAEYIIGFFGLQKANILKFQEHKKRQNL